MNKYFYKLVLLCQQGKSRLKTCRQIFSVISSVYTANWLKVRGQSVLHFSEAIHRRYRSKGLGQKEQRKRNDTSSYICNSQILSYLEVKCSARCTVVYGSSLTARIFTQQEATRLQMQACPSWNNLHSYSALCTHLERLCQDQVSPSGHHNV